jgi:hypothetical protein
LDLSASGGGGGDAGSICGSHGGGSSNFVRARNGTVSISWLADGEDGTIGSSGGDNRGGSISALNRSIIGWGSARDDGGVTSGVGGHIGAICGSGGDVTGGSVSASNSSIVISNAASGDGVTISILSEGTG